MSPKTLYGAHKNGRFTAMRVTLLGKPRLAATVQDVQTYLVVADIGVVPLWALRGLLEQAAAYLLAWGETTAGMIQEAIDKEFGHGQDLDPASTQ